MPAERSVNTPEAYQASTRPDLRVAALAADEWGVLSTDELRGCGLSLNAIAVRARNGRLHQVHRGVYAVGHPNVGLEGRFLAAVKACGPTAVLSHFSAAALYELLPWDDRYPEVTTTAARSHRGIRTHRSSVLAVDDITRHKGIPITTPARTVVDLAAKLDYRPLRRAVRQALRLVPATQIVKTLDRLGPRRGVTNLARILATGHTPTRSELEDAVLDLIVAGGLETPDVNRPLIVRGRRLVPDFRWPTQRLVLEADGAEWHDDRLAREDDAERQALLEAHGERVLRVTWSQAIARRRQTLARLRAAGAPTYTLTPR
jgi:very-short-patch-repair endonuclease